MARKTFRFRLQKLLDIRIMREKLEQQKLVEAKHKLALEQQKLDALKAREQDLVDRMTFRPGQKFHPEERFNIELFVAQVRKDQEQQQWAVDEKQQEVDRQAEVVKQAGIAVKALEKLKEKKIEEHREEQLREEALFLDDLSGQQYIRQQVERERLEAEEAS